MKTLALDIGNVCIKIDFANFARTLGVDAIPEKIVTLQQQMECGKLPADEFIRAVRCHFSLPESRCLEAFNAILLHPVPGMSELVRSLQRSGITPVFFSDISPLHLARTRELFPAAAAVQNGIYSFTAGGQKPSEQMFDAYEQSFGRPLLYVDDRAELISAARKRNWTATVFTSAEALKVTIQQALNETNQ